MRTLIATVLRLFAVAVGVAAFATIFNIAAPPIMDSWSRHWQATTAKTRFASAEEETAYRQKWAKLECDAWDRAGWFNRTVRLRSLSWCEGFPHG